MTTTLVMQLKIENATNLDSTTFSPTYYAKGLPWRLDASIECCEQTEYREYLAVYAHCNWEAECRDWRCDYTADIIILNKDSDKNHTRKLKYAFEDGTTNRGFIAFLLWSDAIDTEKGFIVEGAITIEARLEIEKITGIRSIPKMSFSEPLENISNMVLLVDSMRLHVSKEILAVNSPVFSAMFFKDFREKDKEEVEIKEVDYDHFVDFLNIIYKPSTEITKRTIGHILALADRFQVESVCYKSEDYLLESTEFNAAEKLEFADRFRLQRLTNRCLKSFKTTDDVLRIKDSPEYRKLSSDTKAAILDRIMDVSPQ